jgi:NADPH:quinone reductase-like Zn-dependent oxidoreductase
MKSSTWQFDAYGPPGEALVWRQQMLPEPGPGQALVKIRAIGINRSDLNYVEGQYFPARHFPSCLGTEAVGEVIALGPPGQAQRPPLNRLHLAVGTRVGTLTERIDQVGMGVYRDVGLYDQAALAPVPEVFSNAEGAAFWVAVLTMGGAMEMAGLSAATAPGKTLLITAAASGMGVIALKLARLWGVTAVATTRDVRKVNELSLLADHVLVCKDSVSLADGVRSVTKGAGVDVALDPVGAVFYPGLLDAMAQGGHIVSYECITGTQSTFSIMDMMLKDISIHGFTIFRPFGNPDLLNSLVDLGLDNAQALKPLVSDTFDLADAPQALEVLRRSGHVGKIVLTLSVD